MKLLHPDSGALLSRELELTDPLQPYQRILVADDLSACSLGVLEHALMIAKGPRAQLLIAHVADVTKVIELTYMPAEVYHQWVKEIEETDRKQLQPIVEFARKAGVEAEILTLTGDVGEAILEVARDKNVDLIVMGFHQHGKMAGVFSGSAALYVLRRACCPVLLLPTPKHCPPPPIHA